MAKRSRVQDPEPVNHERKLVEFSAKLSDRPISAGGADWYPSRLGILNAVLDAMIPDWRFVMLRQGLDRENLKCVGIDIMKFPHTAHTRYLPYVLRDLANSLEDAPGRTVNRVSPDEVGKIVGELQGSLQREKLNVCLVAHDSFGNVGVRASNSKIFCGSVLLFSVDTISNRLVRITDQQPLCGDSSLFTDTMDLCYLMHALCGQEPTKGWLRQVSKTPRRPKSHPGPEPEET